METDDGDVMLLRDILARELETINNYQSLSSRAKNPAIAAFIKHITDEEKEHVAEAMQLINRLDQRQAALFEIESHWEGGTPSKGAPSNPPDERIWTVGSLRGREK
jgi:rubrerythrin